MTPLAIETPPNVDRPDPLWTDLYREVLADITYKPGYRIILERDYSVPAGRWYFQVECDRPDAVTGIPGTGRGGKAYLSPHSTRSELVQTVFGLIKGYEEHEAREFFRWRGEQVFGPHFNVEALASIARITDARPAGVDA